MPVPSWLRPLAARLTPHRARRVRPRGASRPRVEGLEDRTSPAVFTVTNTGDNSGVNPAPFAGTGTLRQAIVDANATPTPGGNENFIYFNIPAGDSGHVYYRDDGV